MGFVNLQPKDTIKAVLLIQQHHKNLKKDLEKNLEKVSIWKELNRENKGESTLHSKHDLIYEANILYNITQV